LKVIDRYLLREFSKILLFALLGATFLSILVDLIEKIDTFIDKEAAFSDVLLYYLHHAPYIAILTFPAAMLIASIFTIGQCNRWNELVAMKASGISLYRVLAPIFLFSALISVVVLVVGEAVLPVTNDRKRAIYDHRILKKSERRERPAAIRFQGRRGVLYAIQKYHPAEERMDDVTLVKKDRAGHLVYRIDASRGEWTGEEWVLRNGYLRRFSPAGEEITVGFSSLRSRDIEERPEDFSREPRRPEDMGYSELSRYIDRQRRGGGSTREDEVYLRLKLAFPFANLIIVLFGAPLATISKKGGSAANFGVSLLIFILFWGFIHISRALGESGTLSPVLSAWLANIVFGLSGLVILLRVRK
jgi:lipopolysaccharide export system permease protein